MLTGPDYLISDEKKNFDRKIARFIAPASSLAALGARATFGYAIYSDKRIGQRGEITEVRKIETLRGDGSPKSKAADFFRKCGLDETPQITSIRDGTLSVIGRRQLIPDEYDTLRGLAVKTNQGRNLLAQWDEAVLPYRCGFLSSFAIEGHRVGANGVERRLELDIQDSMNASKSHDIFLIKNALKAACGSRLKYGSLPISDSNE